MSDTTPLTDSQEKTMSILFVMSSVLSLVGSSAIIYKVISDRVNATAYDRLLLGLSACDLLTSISYGLSPFLMPEQTSIRVWAVGSNASCSFIGFMTQLGFSAVLYNGFLSFYYLLTVRYGVKRDVFAKRYEPWFHAVAILFPLTTATVGACMGFYSELQLGIGCWVNDYPKGCTTTNTCTSEKIAWFYGSTPVIFTLFSLIINNTLVYFHVRTVFKTVNTSASDRSLRQKIHKREVATQGLFYVGTFFFSFWSAIAIRVIEGLSDAPVDESKVYWMLVIMSATLPLQGFLNVFVYTRPNYHRVRAAYPDLSWLAAIRKACLDPKIPKLTEISTPSGGTFGSTKKLHRRAPPPGSSFNSNLRRIEEGNEEGEDVDPSGMDEVFQTPGSSDEMEKWGSALPFDILDPSPTELDDDPQDHDEGHFSEDHDHDDGLVHDGTPHRGPPSVLRFTRTRIDMDGRISELSTAMQP